ncbi:hypothetical protein EX30DRAFT_338682 [Ascodesmis nigricans]|uniref:Rad21/Rec8-like protein N-terminal domain-containing protein n=1 Tax=Ascodesmis nigricans TaxID=341454 RepID=A0A4S2N4D9_9PEZI|nr:hypothetical protein EX30DRAFT_338682 [Ascodesmis nigricans]
MFYSETLLSKTGPLAKVWLSANIERKLSKTNVLQTRVESAVDAIVSKDQAPMALRLSGQLLLGVVRIYSRKARYLLEDCNEALMKIKMAFRPGNVDLPSGMTAHNAAQLLLPDMLTESDLMLPDPTLDIEELLHGGPLPMDIDKHRGRANRINMVDNDRYIGSQNLLTRNSDDMLLQPDLDIDIGDNDHDMSTIIGLDAPADKSYHDDLLSEMDLGFPKQQQKSLLEDDELGLDLGLGGEGDLGFEGPMGFDEPLEPDTTIQPLADDDTEMIPPIDKEPVPDLGAEATPVPEDHAIPAADATRSRSGSPLSSVRSSLVRELAADESHYIPEPSRMETEEPEAVRTARQPISRKRKIINDDQTQIPNSYYKQMLNDTSSITIPANESLHRDPLALSLLNLGTEGKMAQMLFNPRHLAPDLSSLLLPDFIRKCADLKRKREAGDADVDAQELADEDRHTSPPTKQARLELGDEGDEAMITPFEQEPLDMQQDESMLQVPEFGEADLTLPAIGDETEDFLQNQSERTREGSATPVPDFILDDNNTLTTAEYHHPQTQTISRDTRKAVHILREQFSEHSQNPSHPSSAVVYQHLLPPATTSRQDAAKMFFEVLVLATKDAVQVKQKDGFGDIHLGPKKALWGSWAEELDEQQQLEENERQEEEEKRRRQRERIERQRVGERREVVVGTGRGGTEIMGAA